jgi:hypothetical protein
MQPPDFRTGCNHRTNTKTKQRQCKQWQCRRESPPRLHRMPVNRCRDNRHLPTKATSQGALYLFITSVATRFNSRGSARLNHKLDSSRAAQSPVHLHQHTPNLLYIPQVQCSGLQTCTAAAACAVQLSRRKRTHSLIPLARRSCDARLCCVQCCRRAPSLRCRRPVGVVHTLRQRVWSTAMAGRLPVLRSP